MNFFAMYDSILFFLSICQYLLYCFKNIPLVLPAALTKESSLTKELLI